MGLCRIYTHKSFTITDINTTRKLRVQKYSGLHVGKLYKEEIKNLHSSSHTTEVVIKEKIGSRE
jgi:hypothetical protein